MPIDPLTRFARDQDGTVAVIASLSMTMLLGFVALGVDVASLYKERARLQSVSDLTAISAMALPSGATERATYVMGRNQTAASALETVQTGRYLRNPAIAPEQRFSVLTAGSPGINAVRVLLKDDAPLYFARVFTQDDHVLLKRAALATRSGAASFALSSYLARIDGAALNRALSQRFGASAVIGIGDLRILADAQVDLGTLMEALTTQIGGVGANPADILNVTTTNAALIHALQSILPNDVASGLAGLASAGGAASFDVSSLVGGIDTDLGLTATGFLAGIKISALDVVRAIVAAETAGQSLVLNANVDVPGVVSTTVRLTAGEPPAHSGWIALGEEGVQLHHAALRLSSDIAVNPSLLGSLGVGVQIAKVNLPIYTELAGSTATLTRIECGAIDANAVVAEFATAQTPLNPANGTSVAALYLGTLPTGLSPTAEINLADLGYADLLDISIVVKVPLLPDIRVSGITLQARSHVAVGASQIETVSYTQGDVENGRITKHFGSGNLLSTAVGELMSPEHLQLRVKPGQEGLVSGLVAPVITTVMALLPGRIASGLSAPVDGVLDATLASIGVQVGVGELTLTGHHCEPIQLVQ